MVKNRGEELKNQVVYTTLMCSAVHLEHEIQKEQAGLLVRGKNAKAEFWLTFHNEIAGRKTVNDRFNQLKRSTAYYINSWKSYSQRWQVHGVAPVDMNADNGLSECISGVNTREREQGLRSNSPAKSSEAGNYPQGCCDLGGNRSITLASQMPALTKHSLTRLVSAPYLPRLRRNHACAFRWRAPDCRSRPGSAYRSSP